MKKESKSIKENSPISKKRAKKANTQMSV